LRVTFRGAAIKNLVSLWPATDPDYTGFGQVPFGARFRLKSTYNISGFSPYAQVLLKQLQQYGLILDDTGSDWSVMIDYTKLPYEYSNVFSEIAKANITPSNFEAVDESSLQVSAASGLTPSAEAVCAANGSGSACQHVVLTGVTLGIPADQMYFQAGAAAQQLTAWVNGTSNRGVTWSMTPAIGTLTSGGLYTPPVSVSAPTAFQITAASNTNSGVSATMSVVVVPSGPMRIIMAGPCGPGLTYQQVNAPYGCVTTPFIDSVGNAWYPQTGDDGGSELNCGTWGSFPSVPNIELYKIAYASAGSDLRFDIQVPNGTYSITAKFANSCSYDSAVGSTGVSLEAQGVVRYPNVDIVAAAGGAFLPVDFTLPATVTNGQLSFVLRLVKGPVGPTISALQIVLTGSATSKPAPPEGVSAIEVK
jgi:Malectin domain